MKSTVYVTGFVVRMKGASRWPARTRGTRNRIKHYCALASPALTSYASRVFDSTVTDP
jgi:hypothetical protein